MNNYASLADLVSYGIPQTAFGTLTDAQKQTALDARAAYADSKFRARYALPLQAPIDVTITQAVVQLAVYDLMMLRGYNPASAADKNIHDRAMLAMAWLNDVERQAAHPNVVEAISPSPALPAPLVLSNPLQGWIPDPSGTPSNPGPSGVF